MTTLAKNYSTTHVETANRVSAYDQLIKKLEFSHFALISMAILIGSCLGGIAAMYVFMNDAPIWQFVIGLGVSLANLVACIGQAPTKWVFNILFLSVVVNTLLVLVNIF